LYQTEYEKKNKSKILEYKRDYHFRNISRRTEEKKKYYLERREEFREQKKTKYLENPEVSKEYYLRNSQRISDYWRRRRGSYQFTLQLLFPPSHPPTQHNSPFCSTLIISPRHNVPEPL
jgi:hypothetical protein